MTLSPSIKTSPRASWTPATSQHKYPPSSANFTAYSMRLVCPVMRDSLENQRSAASALFNKIFAHWSPSFSALCPRLSITTCAKSQRQYQKKSQHLACLTLHREKNELTNEANRIIKTIRQMETSLEDPQPDSYRLNEKELKVTAPLAQCLQDLKEKHNRIAKVHRERFEQIKSKSTSKQYDKNI